METKKKIAILGSTGSIGTQALDIIGRNREAFEVSALSCGNNTELLGRQIELFHPELAVTAREEDARALSRKYPGTEMLSGLEGLIKAATCGCHMVLNALVGIAGLAPTWHAVRAGKDIALANKETLVAGGQLIMGEVQERGVRLLPVDSERSAF